MARVSSPGLDRSSDHRLVTVRWKGRHNSLMRSASCSSSGSSRRFQEEDLLTVDRESCLKSGATMKQLLADEMYKGTESRRRSPSIIARLMGLDGLPAQQIYCKQQKKVYENHQHHTESSGSRKSRKSCDNRTQRRDAQQRHVFKDVYEAIDSPDMEFRNRKSNSAFSPNPNEDEIAFVRKKFLDVKRFSTNEKFQDSEEFRDALDVLYSSEDLLLKFLEEPNSLLAKHLRDLHGISESRCGHVSSMKSANNLKCNIDTIGCYSGGEASRKIDISHSKKRRDSNLHHPYGFNVDSHNVNFLSEDTSLPTRIVVLKPNLGIKVQSNATSVSSPSPSRDSVSDLDLHDKYPYIMHSATEMWGKRVMHKDCDVYESKYRESRELAREFTRRIKKKQGSDSFNVSSSGYRGYSADESSCDMSEYESSYASDVAVASPRTSFSRSIRNKGSTSHHHESAVNKEAKRRLSERWKITSRSQEIGPSGKGSTLADMLAAPDMDIRPWNLDDIVTQNECMRSFESIKGPVELISPLGISSRDGWKDGCIRNLSRSRSLSSSPPQVLTSKSSTKRETLATERFLVRKEIIDPGRSKSLKRESKRSGGLYPESPKASNKKPDFFHPVSIEMIHGMQEIHASKSMMSKTFDVKDSCDDPKTIVLELSPGKYDTTLATHPMMDQEYKNASGSLKCLDEPSMLSQDDSLTCDMPLAQQEPSTNNDVGGSSSLLCTGIGPEYPASSKESGQPSPVSVLETAFIEDTSSGSECFERVSVELNGLRMQLQLLKLESDTYDEGSMAISSDEDADDSAESHDHKGVLAARESWASSYLVEVLNESGLDETNPDVFIATWHSPESPISPRVFENLERKYDKMNSCSKLERNQLFDCINSRIVDISQQFINVHPWVKSLTTNVGSSYVIPKWWKNGLITELGKLVEIHERKVREARSDEEILGSMPLPWMEIGEHINAIGRDIEALLIDELVAEIII